MLFFLFLKLLLHSEKCKDRVFLLMQCSVCDDGKLLPFWSSRGSLLVAGAPPVRSLHLVVALSTLSRVGTQPGQQPAWREELHFQYLVPPPLLDDCSRGLCVVWVVATDVQPSPHVCCVCVLSLLRRNVVITMGHYYILLVVVLVAGFA